MRIQGIKLHKLVEMYLKGSGKFYNKRYLYKGILNNSIFNYNIFKIINTICLIIGK
jgi:hypothetical protein